MKLLDSTQDSRFEIIGIELVLGESGRPNTENPSVADNIQASFNLLQKFNRYVALGRLLLIDKNYDERIKQN